MNTQYEFDQAEENRIVYVRPIKVGDLPEEVQQQLAGRDTVYSVHDAQGAQLAVVGDRRLAFVLARQHDFAPVAVH